MNIDNKTLVYPFMSSKDMYFDSQKLNDYFEKFVVTVDYGTINPFSSGLWGLYHGVWYRLREFYYDSRIVGRQLTDNELYFKLKEELICQRRPKIIVSAASASFIETIRRFREYDVIPSLGTTNEDCISKVKKALLKGTVKICANCSFAMEEFKTYHYDYPKNNPYKANDHVMDEVLYFVNTVIDSECVGCNKWKSCPSALSLNSLKCNLYGA